MKHLTGCLAALALLAASASLAYAGAHTLVYTFDGDESGDRLGHGVAGAGDVNGDGFDDIIAGAYYGNGSRVGYARVYSGKDGEVLYDLEGDSSYDGFGVSVNPAGDVNADGYDDFIVGAHLGDTAGTDSGMVRVFSGKDGSTLYTFGGDAAGDRLGITVNGAGDVNADGYDDVIAGAYYTGNGTAPGYAKVFSGKDGKTLYTFTGDSTLDYFGVYVNRAGDVNKDGYDDVMVGAPQDDTKGTDAGKALVYSGKDGRVLYTWYGPRSSANFGRCLASAGDVNQDGYPDIVVGAYLDDTMGTDSGTVYVYSGKDGSVLYTWYGDASDDRIGVHVDGAGDVDGDGYPDIVAGAYYDDYIGSNTGSARVFSGKDGSILYTWYGTGASQYYGRFAAGAGDVNNDGFADIVVGCYGDDSNGTDCGRVYVYVSPAPSGTVTINDGAPATNDTDVTLSFTWRAAPTGEDVADMRLRNAGDDWGSWISLTASMSWTLPAGDGEKTVEAQFRDESGSTSGAKKAAIVLDQTPPTGSVAINFDYDVTTSPFVSLNLEYSDLMTEVTHVRARNEGGEWSAWLPVEAEISWTLTSGSGMKTVEVQFRDAARNESEVFSDSIEYRADVVAPVIESLRVNGGALYVLPQERLEIEVYGRDNTNGSGVDAFKVSYDGGDTWTDWFSLKYGPIAEVDRPATSGLVVATVVLRDKARNESEEAEVTFNLLESDPPWLGAGAKFEGSISSEHDVDCVAFDLVAGDLLNVKIKGKATTKGLTLDLSLDLVRPDGEQLFEGRYPSDSTKVMVKSFAVPETGEYLLVVRREGGARTGTYKLTAKVKQAKENKKGKGEWTGSEIAFDAVSGSLFKAALKGEGLTLAEVTLVGPEGPVAFEGKEGKGKVAIGAVTLDAGTGTYRIVFAAPRTVVAKWSVKLPKIKGVVSE